MSTAGILQPSSVVFYHPLDNFVEKTLTEAWTGTGGFTPGKIGSANSAVAADAVSWNSSSEFDAGIAKHVSIAKLATDKVLISYLLDDDDTVRACVGTITGTTVTFGAAASLYAGTGGTPVYMDVLTATTAVVMSSSFPGVSWRARVLTISGDDVTAGPENVFGVGNPGYADIVKLDSTTVFAMVGQQSSDRQDAYIGTVSGSDITFGSAFEIAADLGRVMAVDALSSTKAVMVYEEGGLTKVQVATVSGTDITFGTKVNADSGNTTPLVHNCNITVLDASKFVVISERNSDGHGYSQVGTVSGTDVTLGASVKATEGSGFHIHGGDGARMGLVSLDSTHVVITYEQAFLTTHPSRIGTVSGTNITWGASSFSDFDFHFVDSVALSSSKVMYAGTFVSGASKVHIGLIDNAAAMSGAGAYPSTIGSTRVAVAMWAKNLTKDGTTVKVERGYSVDLTSTTISLGGTTAVWSGAGIVTLMSTMNNGTEHLLVLDFEHTGGTNWTLRTSIDGADFTGQGTQTSGTQAVTTADTAPTLELDNPAGSDTWVDELVMWSGNELFTTQELANLNDLADTFDETMDQYEENFGAPICWQATARMPDGTVWRDSGSGPCPPVVRVPRGAEDVVVTDDGNPASPRITEG